MELGSRQEPRLDEASVRDLDQIQRELDAIRSILTLLAGLDSDTKRSVIDYVLKKLNYQSDGYGRPAPDATANDQTSSGAQPATAWGASIKKLKEDKNPQSAIEMAAVVAFYLCEMAGESERKENINTQELETYLKKAMYPIPGGLQYVLGNAKKAGYFDNIGEGRYKLNNEGYNLVAHTLPRKK